ncbi:hypothetical protein AVEN_81114-1 [Araneus ventricosus]|uniref:Uncharacterized protein n=1 Tax=Araneus ventricosus TaxID=182803 RepID=A0A4Y2DVN8_ARAVE|nr:hypothetical protein AVEN_81114-1 [Araneus ventricosus]
MVSFSCITISILLAEPKNCCKSSGGKSGTTPYNPYLSPYLITLCGTRFSSNSDLKTAAENWLNGQGRDFYQARLNKLVLRSDQCLNRFGDYVEK